MPHADGARISTGHEKARHVGGLGGVGWGLV